MSITEMAVTELKGSQQVADDVYDDGYLRVEHQNYYAACDGQVLKLPRTEFLILSRLARTPERIVKSEDLWGYAWGNDKPLNTESLHVYIYRLRNKIADCNCRLQIDTMVNVGYRLILNGSSPN
ncbi:MAG TPA: helix-turn-helix domain-containing protein [Pyrinomonadaceae bacterium]|nr:helix-turn-helix domain-containing protein [Pyrinomonadaceae bacterium]